MSEFPIENIGLKVGLEIHQQLECNTKLFCNCRSIEFEEQPLEFFRKLRAAKSELGEYDPSAIFERSKSKIFVYHGNPQSSCLVEQDDEPPHPVNSIAKSIVLIIASALKSHIFNEIYVMRKLVIDGSNTSGFQRTMLVSQGGSFEVEGKKVGIQSISLEEDAAKILQETEDKKEFSLDRLGIPLIEIALEPISGSPDYVKKVALGLGRLLRSTRQVKRGLGTIRQDVNVSIKGGNVVEIKGVQQIDQLGKVIEYEAKRQYGMLLIASKLASLPLERIDREKDVKTLTEVFLNCKSKVIQKALKEGKIVRALKIRNFSGILGYEPFEGIRLGKQIGELVRFFGLGGIFHSDELPNYGIEESHVEGIRNILKMDKKDAFIILASDSKNIEMVTDSIITRIEESKKGIPSETRMATAEGETIYLRPRPGASRMYPETDIPTIIVSDAELIESKRMIPKSWEEILANLETVYGLNRQLAEQLFDSDFYDIFEEICTDSRVSPNFVASVLCSTITNLERKGLNSGYLKPSEILKTFNYLANNEISKESIEIILTSIMSGKTQSVEEIIKSAIKMIDPSALEQILEDLISNNIDLIKEQGERSIGPLMGIAMKTMRGKAEGQKINQILERKIKEQLGKRN